MIKKFKDPMSTLTHLIALIFCIPITIYLISKGISEGSVVHIVAFAIFGASLILLYGASSFYHMLELSEKISERLRKFDHMMIFILIAGSYTPICLITLKGVWGYTLLALIWGIALGGMIYKLFFINASRKISSAIYLIMGWLAITAFVPIIKNMETTGVILLVVGGIVYTLGGIIYAIKKPNFKNFSFHDIFHVFVMVGSAFHILVMCFYI